MTKVSLRRLGRVLLSGDYNFSSQASPKTGKRVESPCNGKGGALFMKVLIVDDHALIREALHAVLKQLNRDTVILEASNGRQAMRLVEEHPDLSLILLDVNLPDRDGFSVLGELRERYATIAIIVLSALDDQDTVKRAFKLGALGFIPKTTEREVMLNAIQLVLSGGIYIPSEILDREETTSPQPANRMSAREYFDDLGLTGRQIEVLALLMQGKSNKVIAKDLNMGVPTVKNQITVVLKALKVTSRTEAVLKVGKMGWELSPKS
jgi:DNA-binding NarL/FixJ family response regulator